MDSVIAYICMAGPSPEAFNKVIFRSFSQFRKSCYMMFYQAPILPEFIQKLYDFKSFDRMFKINEKGISKDDLEAYKYVFSKKGAQNGPINYYRANLVKMLTGAYNSSKTEASDSLEYSPGLYLHGERDEFLREKFVSVLKKMYPNLEGKVVANASHFLQQDQPKEVNRLIRDFLNEI